MLKLTTDKQTDRQTNKQTGQKQYAPDNSIGGHKKNELQSSGISVKIVEIVYRGDVLHIKLFCIKKLLLALSLAILSINSLLLPRDGCRQNITTNAAHFFWSIHS